MASDSKTSAEAKVSVWWDMEECPTPKEINFSVAIKNIKLALMKMNYFGPVSFSAYVDTTCVPPLDQRAFQNTHISICHVPAGLKDARDKKILVDMLFWAIDHPAPANYLLISGQKDFSDALDQLEMRRYDILLAHPQHVFGAHFPTAKCVWNWASLHSGGLPYVSGELDHNMFLGQANRDARDYPDMLENIASFNSLRRQQIIEYNEARMFRNRNEEVDNGTLECERFSGYKSTGVCLALHYIEKEKMIPTKENIHDFIHYGDPERRNFDVEKALAIELEHEMITMQNLGDISLYIPINGYLWECVNPEGGRQDQYSKATWDSIENYLRSLKGRIKIMISDCRYEACLALRNSCLPNFCLGRVQQIMSMILAKGWILPSMDGWKPVLITLARR